MVGPAPGKAMSPTRSAGVSRARKRLAASIACRPRPGAMLPRSTTSMINRPLPEVLVLKVAAEAAGGAASRTDDTYSADTIRRERPSTSSVKSVAASPVTGRPSSPMTLTSTGTRSTARRMAGGGCCGGSWPMSTATAPSASPAVSITTRVTACMRDPYSGRNLQSPSRPFASVLRQPVALPRPHLVLAVPDLDSNRVPLTVAFLVGVGVWRSDIGC